MNQITLFLTSYGALILFAATFAEQSGLPLPAAPWLLVAGALAADGRMSLFAIICWATLGSLAADTTWFCIGHHGKGWVSRFFSRFLPVRRAPVPKLSVRSVLRGLRILSAAKFLPFGTIVPLRAGTLNISSLRFVLVDAISSLIYASVYILLGFLFHQQLEQVLAFISRLGVVTLALITVFVAGYFSYGFLKRRRLKLDQNSQSSSRVEFPNRTATGLCRSNVTDQGAQFPPYGAAASPSPIGWEKAGVRAGVEPNRPLLKNLNPHPNTKLKNERNKYEHNP